MERLKKSHIHGKKQNIHNKMQQHIKRTLFIIMLLILPIISSCSDSSQDFQRDAGIHRSEGRFGRGFSGDRPWNRTGFSRTFEGRIRNLTPEEQENFRQRRGEFRNRFEDMSEEEREQFSQQRRH